MSETGEEKQPLNPVVPRSGTKSMYLSPSLVEYGSVAKLTQNGQGSGADGGATAGMMMVCL
jgi:hypothetical protein